MNIETPQEAAPVVNDNDEVREHIEKTLEAREETPAKEAKEAKAEEPVAQEASEGSEEAPVQEYKPNTKYTVKGKEFDLPEWAKAAIKNSDSEKEVKEIFEKAAGIDHIKQKHQELYAQNQKVSADFEAMSEGIKDLRNIYQEAVGTGNLLLLDDFFAKLNIPFPVMLNYLQQKVQFQELPEEQQRMFNGSIEAQRRARELEAQNQGLMQAQTQATSQARALQLQSVLGRPEISQVVNHYESLPGRKPGDFWNLVKKEGEYAWLSSNGQVDLSPEEAVQRVIEGLAIQQQQPTMAQQTTNKVVAPHRETASIPNVNAKPSVSPMKKKIRSEEDLKKYYNEKYVSQ